jgi:hypothetical protein
MRRVINNESILKDEITKRESDITSPLKILKYYIYITRIHCFPPNGTKPLIQLDAEP